MSQDLPSLKDLLVEKPSSSILHDRPVVNTQEEDIDIRISSRNFWGQVSNKSIIDYDQGTNIGRYGDNKLDPEKMFIRISRAIETMVKNLANNKEVSTEKLSLHFTMLNGIMSLIGKELGENGLNDEFALEFATQLHGFIDQYVTLIRTQKQ